MMFNPKEMIAAYWSGLGFRTNDVLKPKGGASPYAFGVVDDTVVVVEQSSLAPHQYTVVGERSEYSQPSERFVKFSINGHDWQRVGRA